MFDIGWSELLLVGGVALVVIGPKDLPRALRTLGQTTTKVRRMASDFQRQFSEAMREADMEEFRKGVSDVVDTARDLKNGFNPIDRLRDEIKGAIEKPEAINPLPSVEIPSSGDYLNSLPAPLATGDTGAALATGVTGQANVDQGIAPVKKEVRRGRQATTVGATDGLDETAPVAASPKPRKPRKPATSAAPASLENVPGGQVASVGDDLAAVAPKRRAPRKKAPVAAVSDSAAPEAELTQDAATTTATAPVVGPLNRASDGTP